VTRIVSLLVASPLVCALSFASTSLCPNVPANAVALNSFPADGSTPFGCDSGVTLFSNFRVTSGAANIEIAAPEAGDVFMFARGTSPVDQITFLTPGPGPTWVVPPGDGSSGSGPTLESVITFTAQAGEFNFFTGFDDLLFIGPNNRGGGALTITESYCLGATSLTSCPSGQFGSVQTVQDGLNISSGSVRFAPVNLIAIQVDVTIHNLTDQPFGLSRVPISLHEIQGDGWPVSGLDAAPEPSGVLLIGTGLGLIGFARARRVWRG